MSYKGQNSKNTNIVRKKTLKKKNSNLERKNWKTKFGKQHKKSIKVQIFYLKENTKQKDLVMSNSQRKLN